MKIHNWGTKFEGFHAFNTNTLFAIAERNCMKLIASSKQKIAATNPLCNGLK